MKKTVLARINIDENGNVLDKQNPGGSNNTIIIIVILVVIVVAVMIWKNLQDNE